MREQIQPHSHNCTLLLSLHRSRPSILAVAERLLSCAGVQKKRLLPTKPKDGYLVQYTRAGDAQ